MAKGSERSSGHSGRYSTTGRSDCQLSLTRHGSLASAANDRKPPHAKACSKDATGPDLPLAYVFGAASQLHQTGRPCIAQHLRRPCGGTADKAPFRCGCGNVCFRETEPAEAVVSVEYKTGLVWPADRNPARRDAYPAAADIGESRLPEMLK